ncbi:MAG: metalloregulator ArsR/SmtB family transcription factor, partial [Melioribacteraceae bacterium]|nr:metalloregulator ArsR/SmtB family transcription factor [Melioribacteraceae bacterium]
MITTAQLFKAISDQNRIRILNMLKERILCVCEIRTILGLANSTVSQHLRILKENGFIEESKDGKWVNYS